MRLQKCVNDDCEASVNSNMWARIRAQEAGWFFTQDGKIYCPKHVPTWVAEWRARKLKGAND